MLRTSILAAALLALTTATARAEETTLVIDGHKFVELCYATEKETKLVCASFTLGVSDTLAVWLALRPNSARACIPSAVLLNQLVDVGLDYIQRFPAERHLRAAQLLMVAFGDAWPCKRR
jgi:hypothetical protein